MSTAIYKELQYIMKSYCYMITINSILIAIIKIFGYKNKNTFFG